jgi:hypothetical protein
MTETQLKYIGTESIPTHKPEIRLFAMAHNEALRLPYFLDYYRRLGVNRFFIIDDHSDDGTAAILATQPDCHVFHPQSGTYASTRSGLGWLNELLNHYGDGYWTLFADIDELFTFPGCEHHSLQKFCAYLDAQGYDGIYAILLDLYADTPMPQLNYQAGQDFLKVCSFFDRDYKFVPRISLPWAKAFPIIEPLGGPRSRLFFPEQHQASMAKRLAIKIMFRLLRWAHRHNLLQQITAPTPSPQVFKVPLVRWKHGYGYITSHRLNEIRLAPVTGAQLHFKFFQDFAARVTNAVATKVHFGGSIEYQRYAKLSANKPDLVFTYPGSTRYHSSQDLIDAHLIQDDPVWEKARRPA